jgi:uncharacterized membrane protein|tara:strand:- start:24471 stop:24869 length:399 start_codon:yes stop_codon:yes gene_type:complete
MKKYLAHGVLAGLLSALAAIIFQYIYQEAMFLDFSSVLNSGSIIGSCMLGCMLMAIGFWGIEKINKPKLKGWLNIIVIVLTFLSILGPLSMTLPLDVEFPEMFPGLAIPMHFFPALIFFGLDPFFNSKNSIK